jgi:soluble lytic murein transglycosylase-like protein
VHLLVALALVVSSAILASEARAGTPPGFVTSRASDKPTQSGIPRPGLETLKQYDAWQQEAARRARIDWLFAAAVRIKESFNDPNRVSSTGAVGLMQLMPAGGRVHRSRHYRAYLQARRSPDRRYAGKRDIEHGRAYQRELIELVKTNPYDRLVALDRRFDPQWNIERGTAHLARDLHRFRRRYPTASTEDLLRMTLAAYFAGPGRVGFRQGAPVLPTYTRAYVDDAMAVWRRLRAGKPGR